MRRPSSGALVAVGVIGVGSLVASSVGIAVAATSTSVIHACVAKSDGALRVVAKGHKCASDEKALSFNTKGPRGLPAAKPATFQMFGNVDAEGDLGSNYLVKSVHAKFGGGLYYVTFKKSIAHCALMVTSGEAGGPDAVRTDVVSVKYDEDVDPTHQALVTVLTPNGDPDSDPFMITATCPT
jgi:hypothetical protein